MIDAAHPQLSIRHQCALLDLAPSTYYHKAQPTDADDLEIMRAIDQQYLETPFYGVERMTWALREAGHVVNEKRVRRLMRLMALEAIYPKPRTSHPGRTGTHYPYLLKGLKIDQPDHVWATDITYIPLRRGYCYLTAIMDWATRYVIAWEISNTLDALFCIETLQRALATGRQPQILNTDQGAQYTCADYVDRVVAAGIRPSWDGPGRWVDNVFVERLWRSYKYEWMYRHAWETPKEARHGSGQYFEFYNYRRGHTSLDKMVPAAVYFKITEKK
jgi:putative transposase